MESWFSEAARQAGAQIFLIAGDRQTIVSRGYRGEHRSCGNAGGMRYYPGIRCAEDRAGVEGN